MKALPKAMNVRNVLFTCFFLLFILLPERTYAEQQQGSTENIMKWQMKWGDQDELDEGPPSIKSDDGWSNMSEGDTLPEKPYSNSTAWIKIHLPTIKFDRPGMLLSNIFGQRIKVFLENKEIYSSNIRFLYDKNNIFLPLEVSGGGKNIYIGIQTTKDQVGIQELPQIGNSEDLLHQFLLKDVINIILGSSFLFIALVIFICSIFLNKVHSSSWISLSIIIAGFGVLVLIYSPFLYTFYNDYSDVYLQLLDVALFVLIPSMTYFFELVLGTGYHSILTKFRKFQCAYSIVCFICLVVYLVIPRNFFEMYYNLTVDMFVLIVVVQLVLLTVHSIMQALKGNRNGILLAVGLIVLEITCVTEFIWFLIRSGSYDLFIWKWGVTVFILSLILVLGRNYAQNHNQVIKYAKELELFNTDLHRSEKLSIISELAASVAHEVKNPLQVTRGFLQFLTNRYSNQEKIYITMALEELDRASNIITDFLTFAKPQFESITLLDLNKELKHVEGIMMPLANLQGGRIQMQIPVHLRVKGNSSKLKQAFINVIKNSIEALSENGEINIWAYEEEDQTVIHIQDNGEGMSANELIKLGEPYFSSKTKGTGLGLMVSYRIIEVMDGSIEFKSEKGVGTEAIIRLPSAND
ncbi:hypothetical protein JCM16418A_36470 [Paenibacillus pini]